MTFTINAGEKKVLTATYSDGAGHNHPLGSVPVATCATKEIVLTPKTKFDVADLQFQWDVAATAKAVAGVVEIVTHAKNMAGADIEGKYSGTVTALDNTQVALRVD